MASSEPIVRMRGITKTFGSTRALRGVDFTVMRGEVHALLGRNGAGKSTLVSTLSGVVAADSGEIRIGAVELSADGQPYAARLRDQIAHVQQTPRLFDLLTIAENLFLEHPDIRKSFGIVSHARMLEKARQLLQDWALDLAPEDPAGTLDAGMRQLLEIMKALSRGVPIMILDEPTAALSNAEKRMLFEQVERLKRAGVSFIYISHHLDEIFEVADTVTILRDGQVVTERAKVSDLDVDLIANLMMGAETKRSLREDHTRLGQALLTAQAVQLRSGARPLDLVLRRGEILALAGPVGGGKEDLALVLAGLKTPLAGKVSGPDRIGLVPTDRHMSGYVGLLGVRENVALGGLDMISNRWGFIQQATEAKHIGALAREAHIVSAGLEQPVSQLSGGNQQKVVFARALCRNPEVVVALSPTRGVDVGAKEQLYALLRDLSRRGLGVVVVSDEEDEIAQLANRVVIVVEGEVVDEMEGDYSMKDLILRMEGVA